MFLPVCSEYKTDSLPKCLNYNVENKKNSSSVPHFRFVQISEPEIEMKNFINPGLAYIIGL